MPAPEEAKADALEPRDDDLHTIKVMRQMVDSQTLLEWKHAWAALCNFMGNIERTRP